MHRSERGGLVADDSAFSPRVGVVWDPTGDGEWSVHAGYGKYVAAIANTIADSASPNGTPSILAWFYRGPGINTVAGAPLVGPFLAATGGHPLDASRGPAGPDVRRAR